MAVSAYPTILVDSTDGAASDTACSGAGPATALTGSSGTTNAGGTIVTLDGSPDLSGVATDGSHVIFYNDTTAGARRFAAINAKDDGADTVTVEQALAGSHGATAWAIGGVRATLLGAESELLYDNNGSAGDAMPGWIVEMKSGHAETFSSGNWDTRRAGDTTDGPITIRGVSGAATRPKITVTGHGSDYFLARRANFQRFQDFDVDYNLAAGGGRIFAQSGSSQGCAHIGLKLNSIGASDATVGIDGTPQLVVGCEISGTSSHGLAYVGQWAGAIVHGCYIHDCDGNGIDMDGSSRVAMKISQNIIADCAIGIVYDNARTDEIASGSVIDGNTIYSCTSHGIDIEANTSTGVANMRITNNLLHSNGGYGINFTDTEAFISAGGNVVDRNGFKSNTSGEVNRTGIPTNSVSDGDVDNASFGTSGDFSLGSSSDFKAAGFPNGQFPGAHANSTSYVDIGAVQRQEPAGGGGGGVKLVGKGGLAG